MHTKKEVMKILEENKITNVFKKKKEEEQMKESIKQKEERKAKIDLTNKILKGSG